MTWADGLDTSGFRTVARTVNKDGEVTSERQVLAEQPGAQTHVPDPVKIKGVSTLYDATGEMRQQWVKEVSADEARRIDAFREFLDEFRQSSDRVPEIRQQTQRHSPDLMTAYPVGDHHMGMLAWWRETGASHDLGIGEELLIKAFEHLIGAVPPCDEALIPFLGDFAHYDSFVAQTPSHNNPLDADGRYPKMVRAASRVMRHVINSALAWHRHVTVIVESGNHDPALSVCFREMLDIAYENNGRVSIDISPKNVHYYEWGKVLIGTHHGDKITLKKPEQLSAIMATDMPEAWGRTQHRYWYTGHVHSRTFVDTTGASVESFRILPPPDAWAANQGYRSRRGMYAIVHHKEHGEVARHYVNPEMLK